MAFILRQEDIGLELRRVNVPATRTAWPPAARALIVGPGAGRLTLPDATGSEGDRDGPMPNYRFLIALDDHDLAPRVADSSTVEAAIEEACDAMMALVYILSPALARCVVFADGERLGEWIYRPLSLVPDWTETDGQE